MAAPDTIVLLHGLWMTPRSWEKWVPRYEEKGYKVITPAYPGLEVEVEALNADPTPIAELTISKIYNHLAGELDKLESQPIIMGHSAGGVFTQLLLDRDYGAVGVTYCSAPTENVPVVPLSQLKSTFPAFKNPANRHRAVPFTHEQFHYAFTNTLSEEDSRAIYDRYYIPGPGSVIWGGVLANFTPGHQDAWVNYKNEDRAPLLFASASEDHIMPPKVQRSNAKHYKAEYTFTEHVEFPDRDHAMCATPGWEEIADFGLDWALAHVED